MKNATEIRTRLLEHLQLALRSPSMFGGETAIVNLMGHLTFIDERESEWNLFRKELFDYGAFKSTGVKGGFWNVFKENKIYENEVASVYALFAIEQGYMNSDVATKWPIQRVLDAVKFEELICALDRDYLQKNWHPDTVIGEFGDASLRWGTNDNYPCTLLYVEEILDDGENLTDDEPAPNEIRPSNAASHSHCRTTLVPFRYCAFDFWAEWYKDETGCRVPGKYGPKPILGNVRMPAATFAEEFRFTGFGESVLNAKSE